MTTMAPHPDFAALDLPRDFALGAYRLTPLTHAQVEEDYAAVMATAPLFGDFFGEWPEGLTLEENLIDLAWHDREFTTRRSFSWILRDGAGTYLGCFYIAPQIGARGRATAALWLCNIPDRHAVCQSLKADLSAWMASHLPSDLALSWTTSPDLGASSD